MIWLNNRIRRWLKMLDDAVPHRARHSNVHVCNTLTSPLAELKPSQAIFRLYRFAKSPFFVSLIFGTMSVAGSIRVESIVVAAITGLMSLTLIKLFFYLSIILLGSQIAVRNRPSLFAIIQRTSGFLCDVGFDCVSTSLGVILGASIAMSIEGGLLKTILTISLFGLMLAFINALFWTTSSLDRFSGIIEKTPRKILRFSAPVGLIIMCTGLAFLVHESWNEVSQNQPKHEIVKASATCTSFCFDVHM